MVLKVDDRLTLGTPPFLESEELAGTHFKTKRHNEPTIYRTLFHTIQLRRGSNREDIVMDQEDKIERFDISTEPKAFESMRAMCSTSE